MGWLQCNVNGNVVNWVAEGPVFDTELPPDRNCQLRRIDPSLANGKLVAQAVASCDVPLRELVAEVRLDAWIDNNGERVPVPLLFDGRASADDDDDGRLDGSALAE